jgi:hypothetical protein
MTAAAKPEARPAWETVCDDDGGGGTADWLERMKVPGGWLYRSTQARAGSTNVRTESMCFVPEGR